LATRSKKQTATRFVELNINLKVPRKQYPKVEEALTAVLEVAGLKFVTGKSEKPKAPSARKPGRPPAAASKAPKTAVLIRDLRNKAGLSQKSLADKLGVRQNTVSLLETGRQKPNLDTAIKLGQIFETPHRNFFEENGQQL
jgi:DNA-binding XRE family transcriptional regulator